MPIGDHWPPRARRDGGFTYLLLLFALALGGVGLAALGEQARTRALREQEAEFEFRGEEIARAIASYVAASPATSRALPQRVEDLLEDRRSGRVMRHLRAWRPEPLGGQWVLLRTGDAGCSAVSPPSGTAVGIAGVRTDLRRPLLRHKGGRAQWACDVLFRYEAFLSLPARPAASAGVEGS